MLHLFLYNIVEVSTLQAAETYADFSLMMFLPVCALLVEILSMKPIGISMYSGGTKPIIVIVPGI